MSRDDQIRAILEVGRQTRKPTPRWLWIAAVVVGVICATGFVVAMLGERAATSPPRPVAGAPAAGPASPRARTRPGLGVGLLFGAGAGAVIGVAIARQRRGHSSRRSP
ncbi:MAG TPA: hypothetical protein VFK02_11765 [Kofleriaceae bacterium]|nr:hypothetical protein [Kofleriaceae bacterium]